MGRRLVVGVACQQGAVARAHAIEAVHRLTPWRIERAFEALGRVELHHADLGSLPVLTVVGANGAAFVAINEHLIGTPLEGAVQALAASRIIHQRTTPGDADCCPDANKEWTVAARLAVPVAMVAAQRSGLISATDIEQTVGVPLALVNLALAITPKPCMPWGSQKYLTVRETAVAEWLHWLSGAAEWARLRAYDRVLLPDGSPAQAVTAA